MRARKASRRLVWLSFLVLTWGLVGRSAFAQGDEAAAQALYEEGRALMEERELVAACDKLAESQKLSAKASTSLWLGTCHEKRGRFATAWTWFGTAVTLAGREGDAELAKSARERRAAMETLLARLTIRTAKPLEGMQITLDGRPVTEAMLDTALPIDPGTHVLAAHAPGARAWTSRVVVPAVRADIIKTIPDLRAEVSPKAEGPPGPKPKKKPGSRRPRVPPREVPRTSLAVYIGFSFAGAGLVLGAITGIVTIANTHSIEERCNEDGVCPPEERQNIKDAKIAANMANVSFGVAIAGATVGIIGLFLGPDESPELTEESSLSPMVGPGFLGVRGRF
jgi:hypothetical protein